MEKNISSLNSQDLKTSLDDNNISFWSSFGKYREGLHNPDPDFFWSISKIPLYSYNGVLKIHLSREKFKEKYRYFMDRFGEKNFPLIWWINPHYTPEEVSDHLKKEGWKDEGFFPAMAAELSNIGEDITLPPDFSFKKASSPGDKLLWTELMNRGMGLSEKVINKAVEVDQKLSGPEVEKQIRFIGYLDEKPVATTLLLPDSGLVGIFGVATLPEARGRGIATAMTQKAMLEGKTLGYRVATLVATTMGLPVYEKLGFKKVFSYHCFSWKQG